MQRLLILIFISILFSCKKNTVRFPNTHSLVINKQIELLRIAYVLALKDSIPEIYLPCKNDYYKKQIEPYLGFDQHPLVQTIRNGEVWSGDLPVLALAFDADFNIREGLDTAYLNYNYEWYGKNLDSVATLLADFKKEIQYQHSIKPDFTNFIDSIKTNQISQKLNAFFRTTNTSQLKIYFDPLNNITNKAITFLNDDKDNRHFLIGYFCDHPDTTSQQLQLEWDEDYRRIAIHENAHLYTDRLLDKYYDEELKKLIQQEKHKETYTNIDEIIVRGLTSKIIGHYYGENHGKEDIQNQPPASKIIYTLLDNYLETPEMEFEDIYKEFIVHLKSHFK